MTKANIAWGIGCATFAVACFPSFDDRPWLVEDRRILAVRGVPAEARPNHPVQFEALVASSGGTENLAVEWAFCLSPRNIAERTGVSAVCAEGLKLETVPDETVVIADACSRFGPNPPPTSGDEAPRRPADPDPSGGYFLPVRARVNDTDTGPAISAFGFQRIRCDLAGATRDVFEAYQDQYELNLNPAKPMPEFVVEGADPVAIADGAAITAGESALLRLPVAADTAEPFVVYAVEENRLLDRTESLRVAWYMSAGTLDRGTEILEGDDIRSGSNVFQTNWIAPTAAGTVFGWVVLRDSRGGTAWSSFQLEVN